MNVRFVVTKPESKRKTFSVKLPIVVGRSEEAKFRIQQDRVSRKHCEFFTQDGGVYLRDLGSTNGTFLNGELVETSVKMPLEPGAMVRVGGLEFRIEFEAQATPSGIRAAAVDAGDDRTVGLAQAPDSEHLRVEHAEGEPLPPAPAILTAEVPTPVGELPSIEVMDDVVVPGKEAAETPQDPVDNAAFGFLAEHGDVKSAEDDGRLDDFLKGLP